MPETVALTGFLLLAQSLIVAALLVCGCLHAAAPRRLGQPVQFALPVLCGAGAVLALAYLAAGAAPGVLTLPVVGLPGLGMALGLDGLSAVFLLLIFVSAGAAGVYALGDAGRTGPLFPVFIAGMALTLLGADAFALMLGFELMSLASWGLVLTQQEQAENRSAALLYLGMALFGAACLVPAFALLAPPGPGFPALGFAAIRAAPPAPWRAGLVLFLALLGAGSKAGLAPLHLWLPLAHPAAPSHVSAVMSGAMTKVALYVLIRILFDLCGGPQPVWWGVPLLAAGVASAVLGALRANMQEDLKSILAASTVENVGLVAIGLGVALVARGADLVPLTALALGAALLHALNHGAFKTLLFLGAGAAQHGAGTRRLDRLGGLIHAMPVTTLCVLAGAASLAALPPAAGFASEWMLFQSLLSAPRIGGLAVQTLLAVAAALMALAAALAAAAAVRMVGVGFLGRPRTPRTAAAQEAPAHQRAAMLGLAGLVAVLGLLPGPVLHLIGPALRALTGDGVNGRAGLLSLAGMAEGPGYSALGIALLLALAMLGIVWVVRRHAVPGERRAPAWGCGFAAAPDWLPFGDPTTQYGGAGFSQPLRRSLGTALLAAREEVDMPAPGETRPARLIVRLRDPAEIWLHAPLLRARVWLTRQADRMQFLTIRRTLVVMFAALVLFLIAIAAVDAP